MNDGDIYMSANKKEKAIIKSGDAGVKKKWWSKKKIIALSVIGAALLAASVFLGVVIATTVFPIRSSAEESRVVGTVGDYEVKYEELRYITLLNKSVLDSEMGEYEKLDGDGRLEYEKLLEERVLEDIKGNYVILSLCDKYGIKKDSLTLRMRVQDDIQSFVDETFDGSAAEYKKWLSENGLTDSFMRFTYRVNYLEIELQEYFVDNEIGIEYDDKDFDGFIEYVLEEEDWARTIHAFYPKHHDYIDVTKSEAAANEAYAKLASIKNNEERFEAMRKTIGSAPMVGGFSVSTLDGIYFTFGQMGEEYEKASFALDEYGVAPVVETEDGYYVIMRLPIEKDYVDAKAAELLEQYRYASLKRAEDAVKSEIEFDGNEYFDGISLIDIE